MSKSAATPIPFDSARHCGAQRRSDDLKGPGRKGQPCRRTKGAGTDHRGSGRCILHGGTSPNGETQAGRERAAKALEGLGQPIATDPQRALMDMVAWSAGRIQAIVHQYGRALDGAKPDHAAAAGLLAEFGNERDRMVRTAKVTLDADIAERQTKVSEELGRYLVRAITAGLDAAHLTGPKRRAAVQAAVDELHRIDAEAPAGVGRN